MWLNELWRRWMGQAPRQLRRRYPASRLQPRLALEALEERTLLSNPATTADLIAAINSANISGTPTTITLAPNTNFGFASADNFTNGANALPVITTDITITGSGFDNLTRESGSTPFRLFDVASGGTLNLINLALQGGVAKGTGTAADGGAIYSSGTLSLSGVTVGSNAALGSDSASGNGTSAFGGGLYVAGGSVSLSGGTLFNNRAVGGNGGSGNGENGGSGGSGLGGGLYVASASNVTLSNATLSNNLAQGGNGGNGGVGGLAGSGAGGGAYVAAASDVTLSNDFVNSNVALGANSGSSGSAVNPFGGFDGGTGEGGGMVLQAGNANLSNDSFNFNGTFGGNGGDGGNGVKGHDHSAGGVGGDGGVAEGGGLIAAVTGTATVSADTFGANLVEGGRGGSGGNGGNAGNAGAGGNGGSGGFGSGGGLFVEAGNFTLTNDTIANNLIQNSSGGGGGNGGTASLSFLAHSGAEGMGGTGGKGGTGAGGGLYVAGGTLSLLNDTISANSINGGVGGGGGISPSNVIGTTLLPVYVDVILDGADGNGGDADGGGVFLSPNNAALSLANTLIAANSIAAGPGGTGPFSGYDGSNGDASAVDVSGSVISSDDDLIGNADGSSGFSAANGDQLGSTTYPINPQLAPLNPNGGPTDTMAELPNSLAIGKGDVNALQGLATDQRGAARTVVVNGIETVDIGAYEFGAAPPSGTPALAISGSGASSTTPGGPITYTITVTNTSSTAQSNVDVVDQLPANTTLVSWTAASGWSSSAPPAGSSHGTVSASIASLPANSSATFTLVVQVAAGTPAGTVIDNTASFGPFDETSNSGTNSARFNTPVLYAPKLQFVDAGGNYNGNPYPATATAVGIDGITPVAGSFSYTYYAGTNASGTPLSAVPVNAGTYTVVATFTSNDPNYSSGGTAQTTFTIRPARISYTIGNDTQAYGYPANLAADLPASFSTSINGETLDITYSSNGDTSTALVETYAITGVVSNGTGLASNYNLSLTNGTLTVLGSGVTVVGSTLWIVGGTTSNDNVAVFPAGTSTTGSTGITVAATLNRVPTWTTHSQPFTTLYIFLYSGNDNIYLFPTLTLSAKISAGNGNDNLLLDDGNNTVTLGNGNDNILGGKGSNNVTAGNGNDNVVLGDGTNTVTVGNGNDNIIVGNGDNVIVEGNGDDNVLAGNGDNLIVAGLAPHNVQVGNGSNILIDGSVQLTQSGDSLRQVLDDWVLYGAEAANVARIRSRLSVTYNTHYANTLHAGSGLDWFWATDAQDHLNVKSTDLLN